MKYAVIRVNGKQYKVSEGDEIRIDGPDKTDVKDIQVLMLVDGDKVQLGEPVLDTAKVSLKYLEEVKGDKIHVRKYKAKSRYRKHIGSRAHYSLYKVDKI